MKVWRAQLAPLFTIWENVSHLASFKAIRIAMGSRLQTWTSFTLRFVRLVGWLVGRSVDRLIGRSVGRLVGWFVCCFG